MLVRAEKGSDMEITLDGVGAGDLSSDSLGA